MERLDYWKHFEQTGAIMDYLHYVNSARDEVAVSMMNDGDDERERGEEYAGRSTAYGNGSFRNSGW